MSRESMKLKPSSNIFDSLKFYYQVNKFVGYLFFSIRKDESEKFHVETTIYDVIIFITTASVVTVASVLRATHSRWFFYSLILTCHDP